MSDLSNADTIAVRMPDLGVPFSSGEAMVSYRQELVTIFKSKEIKVLYNLKAKFNISKVLD